MGKSASRRDFIKQSNAATPQHACVTTLGTQDQPLLRFRSYVSGGTYGYKFSSYVVKWAAVTKHEIIRDWRVLDFAYITFSRRPIEQIRLDMKKDRSSAGVEIL
jgi:hypothetical protein